ncbi:MAG: hypothetical protein JWR87_2433 [Segetibacter sp.]|jgi:hypothetical protein|nr:hypothetical protein [Segetibacter sp.]
MTSPFTIKEIPIHMKYVGQQQTYTPNPLYFFETHPGAAMPLML